MLRGEHMTEPKHWSPTDQVLYLGPAKDRSHDHGPTIALLVHFLI